jgi:hypothetical protein
MFFEYWMFTINEFLSVNLLCKTETALWYRCCISVFRRNCSNQLTHSHHTVEDANEHLWRDYTWLISLIDNDIHTRNDREASMDVHLLSVLLLHSEVQEKQYRKHTMWREKNNKSEWVTIWKKVASTMKRWNSLCRSEHNVRHWICKQSIAWLCMSMNDVLCFHW